MRVEDGGAHGVDTRPYGHQLRDHILTGAALVQHLRDAANLALNATQTRDQLVWCLLSHGRCLPRCRPGNADPGSTPTRTIGLCGGNIARFSRIDIPGGGMYDSTEPPTGLSI